MKWYSDTQMYRFSDHQNEVILVFCDINLTPLAQLCLRGNFNMFKLALWNHFGPLLAYTNFLESHLKFQAAYFHSLEDNANIQNNMGNITQI